MGSAAVAIMVGETLASDVKKLHPFFSAPTRAPTLSHTAADSETTDWSQATSPEAEEEKPHDNEDSSGPKRKRRKGTQEGPPEGKRPRGRPRKTDRVSSTSTSAIANHFIRADPIPLPGPVPAGGNLGEHPVAGADTDIPLPLAQAPEAVPRVEAPRSSALEILIPIRNPSSAPGPKKLLKLNPMTGTIGSPPKPKELKPEPKLEKRSTSARKKNESTKVVRIKYGSNDGSRTRIGRKIDAILSDTSPDTSSSGRRSGAASSGPDSEVKMSHQATPEKPSATKSTHPFFLGKAQKGPTVSAGASPPLSAASSAMAKRYTSTPCSPKKPRAQPPKLPLPQFGMKGAGLKIPGAKMAAWPWKEIAHVRGLEPSHPKPPALRWSLRKSKGHSVSVGQDESVLEKEARRLDVPAMLDEIRTISTDEFLPPPSELRLPHKHFESGRKLQARVAPQVKRLDASLTSLFGSIQTTLSAFDRSQCETQSWTYKYAPTCATEVLQPDQQPVRLREWLKALKVQSVDTGPGERPASSSGKRGSSKAVGDGAKKKRKRSKLDGFIVSSDEEADEMDDNPRLANAVVISGPHGCGKTSAVYAVARELDFDVFEINPSSRRGGKDVLERIGDMTRNHHVQSSSMTSGADSIAPGETVEEIASGKQPTMNAFFKPKKGAKTNKSSNRSVSKQQPAETKKAAAKSQRQSLILLEEVDILYEEDKQFWATVMGLITQSKRPFVMTCNDESLVPVQSLHLLDIFRFSPPPTESAVDRLLMIAANEGHVLRRDAIESLYEARGHDFRASLTDLNFWCQIGVGDRRGGFDWFVLRWPKGIDLDEDKQVIRVLSEDTYQDGMGWLGRDIIQASSPVEAEEELLKQAWREWRLDMGHWQDSPSFEAWARSLSSSASTDSDRLAVLESYDNFADAMSVADIASSMAFATGNQEHIDPTEPTISAKVREDYIIGLELLEAPVHHKNDFLGTSISSSLKCLSRQCLRAAEDLFATRLPVVKLNGLQESQVLSSIRNHTTGASALNQAIRRLDFAKAFDPIAAADESLPMAYLEPSVFDRSLEPIALDIAPFVRGIIAYETRLQKQRLKLSNLVSQGGRSAQENADHQGGHVGSRRRI